MLCLPSAEMCWIELFLTFFFAAWHEIVEASIKPWNMGGVEVEKQRRTFFILKNEIVRTQIVNRIFFVMSQQILALKSKLEE